MPTIKMQTSTGSRATFAIRAELLARLRRAPVGERLVAQAKRRIRNSGDSTVKYPELWANQFDGHFRSGGTPLRDTGQTYNSLSWGYDNVQGGAKWTLFTSLQHAIYQHRGFETKGPNFIPFTIEARRNWTWLRKVYRAVRAYPDAWSPANIREELARWGLIEGETYIMAWDGVTVPPRPIFNLPPEDVAEIRATVRRSLKQRRT